MLTIKIMAWLALYLLLNKTKFKSICIKFMVEALVSGLRVSKGGGKIDLNSSFQQNITFINKMLISRI
jgi:hypothetical protein